MMKIFYVLGAMICTTLQTKAQTTLFAEQFETSNGLNLPVGWNSINYGSNSNLQWQVMAQPGLTNPMGFSGKTLISGGPTPDSVLLALNMNLVAGNSYTATFQITALELFNREITF
jgi:hypothetical protein